MNHVTKEGLKKTSHQVSLEIQQLKLFGSFNIMIHLCTVDVCNILTILFEVEQIFAVNVSIKFVYGLQG